MANPQTEKGYTRIANEILEQIFKTNLNGTQLKIVMVIWRYTYGFTRKKHELSLTFLSQAINTKKSHIDRELTTLIDRNIISVFGIGVRRGRILSFNKNYDEWDNPGKVAEPPLKKELEKPKKKARSQKQYPEDSQYYKMAVYFIELLSNMVKAEGINKSFENTNSQSWADDFRKLVEIDKVTDKKQIFEVMNWVVKDSFWKVNVLSANKFRKHYLTLSLRMKESASSKQPSQQPQKDSRDKDIEFQKWIANGGDPSEFKWS